MSKQIETLQVNQAEKEKLLSNISDLEAELMIMREEGKGASLETKKMVARLNEDLKISQKEITGLQKRLETSDDSSITAVVLIEEELLEANAVNADLRAQLESLQDEKTRTIDLLEKELATAVSKLDSFEEGKNNDIVDLRKANDKLTAQLEQAEARNLADLAEIEDELADALKQKEVAVAESQNLLAKLNAFEEDTPQEFEGIIQNLEDQLKEATAKLEDLSTREDSKAEESILGLDVMEELENELANSLTELEKASDNILTLRNENGDLRDEIEKLKEDLRIDGKGDAQNEALKQEALAMLEGELAGAIENLEQANIQINNLSKQKNELTLQLSENKLNSSSKDQEKIKLLEDKLEESLLNLAELEKKSSVSPTSDKTVEGEAIQRLETDLAKSEATVSELQEKLTKEKQEREKLLNDFKLAGEQISRIEASKNKSSTEKIPAVDNDLEAYKLLEEQLVASQLEVEALRQRNEAEEQGRIALEERLDKAISMIAQSKLKPSDSNSVVSPDVADLKEEIRNKNSNLSDLKKQLDMAIEELALKESELEILQATIPQPRDAVPNESEEITMLTQEIESLKDSCKC